MKVDNIKNPLCRFCKKPKHSNHETRYTHHSNEGETFIPAWQWYLTEFIALVSLGAAMVVFYIIIEALV